MMQRVFGLLLVGVLVSGCVTEEQIKPGVGRDAPARKQAEGESGLRQAWVGKNRTDLIKAFGPPQSILGATVLGRPPTEAYVFNAGKGLSEGCTHAFTVLEETGEVVDYFCR